MALDAQEQAVYDLIVVSGMTRTQANNAISAASQAMEQFTVSTTTTFGFFTPDYFNNRDIMRLSDNWRKVDKILTLSAISPLEKNISANTTLAITDVFVIFDTDNTTATLEAVANYEAGATVIFKAKAGVSGSRILPNGTETIDGINSAIIIAPGESLTIKLDNAATEWMVL